MQVHRSKHLQTPNIKSVCSEASVVFPAAQARNSLGSKRQNVTFVLAQLSLWGTCSASGLKGLSRDDTVCAEAADCESQQHKSTQGWSPGKAAQQGPRFAGVVSVQVGDWRKGSSSGGGKWEGLRMSLENGLCKQEQWKQQSAESGKEEQGEGERMAVRLTQNNPQEPLAYKTEPWPGTQEMGILFLTPLWTCWVTLVGPI